MRYLCLKMMRHVCDLRAELDVNLNQQLLWQRTQLLPVQIFMAFVLIRQTQVTSGLIHVRR